VEVGCGGDQQRRVVVGWGRGGRVGIRRAGGWLQRLRCMVVVVACSVRVGVLRSPHALVSGADPAGTASSHAYQATEHRFRRGRTRGGRPYSDPNRFNPDRKPSDSSLGLHGISLEPLTVKLFLEIDLCRHCAGKQGQGKEAKRTSCHFRCDRSLQRPFRHRLTVKVRWKDCGAASKTGLSPDGPAARGSCLGPRQLPEVFAPLLLSDACTQPRRQVTTRICALLLHATKAGSSVCHREGPLGQ
jgi:hypothetical protein